MLSDDPFALLAPAAARWGVALDETKIAQFRRYAALLQEWNAAINLTSVVDDAGIVTWHLLDSLSCASAWNAPACLIDVGSGAGFPGLALKIAFPALHVALSDSVGKKTAFLRAVVDDLALDDVTVLTARAEDLGQDPAHRERYDCVVARAVAELRVLAEYCLPLARVGGVWLAQKGGGIGPEVNDADAAIDALGGGYPRLIAVEVPTIDERTLVVVPKRRHTPPDLPRLRGVPKQKPL